MRQGYFPKFFQNDIVPQYLKLESTDGQTVKVYFNPSSSKSSYQDLSEEERQKIKDLLLTVQKLENDMMNSVCQSCKQ
jgi:hypothetical protein